MIETGCSVDGRPWQVPCSSWSVSTCSTASAPSTSPPSESVPPSPATTFPRPSSPDAAGTAPVPGADDETQSCLPTCASPQTPPSHQTYTRLHTLSISAYYSCHKTVFCLILPVFIKTSGRSNLTKRPHRHHTWSVGSIVFARWSQCAPLSNTCFLGPPEYIT